MIRRPPRSTRTDTLFPYTTLFRSRLTVIGGVRYSSERKRYEGSLVPALPSKIAAKTFSDVTPRASVRYALSDYANIYFTFSQGFKSGQFNSASFSPVPIEPEKKIGRASCRERVCQ